MKLLFALFGVSLKISGPHLMRYPSAGDWLFLPDDEIRVIVVDTGSWRYNFLVALHEAIEAKLCRAHGISQQQVDTWDTVTCPMLRDARPSCSLTGVGDVREGLDEPGNWKAAPYHREHMTASKWERRAARLLLVDWDAYSATIDALFPATANV